MRSETAISVLVTILLWTSCSRGQSTPASKPTDTGQPTTKLETFLGKRGRLIVKDSYELGKVGGLGVVEMDGLVIYEPGSRQKMKGLRVEVTEAGRLERSNTSFIDLEELQNLSEALTYISDIAKKWSGQSHEPYTEIIYTSKGEFRVGFYQKGTETSAFVKSGTVGAATAYMKAPEIDRMKSLVDQAIMVLNSK